VTSSSPHVTAVRLRVSGRVQGVGFRYFIHRRATALGLAGSVRNLPDGRVEVVAAGVPERIRELELVVARGPRFSEVTNVEKTSIPHDEIVAKMFTII